MQLKKKILVLAGLLGSLTTPAQQSYFQQDVEYKIEAELFPEIKMLTAVQHFKYTNNSSMPLEFIWFHLYPNAFKDESTPFAKQMVRQKRWTFSESKPEEKGCIEADFMVNGEKLTTEFKPDAIDEVKVTLPKPLLPGESIEMEIPFKVKLPKVFSRIGYEESGYSITQWYPKVVVFDKYGWHPDSYLDFGEFYGEFGTFDVTFTLPKNFVMDATGLLDPNSEEQKFMDQSAKEYKDYLKMSDDARSEFRKSLKDKRKITSDYTKKKTVRYQAKNVQDFAMFCSEYAMVDKKVSGDGVVSYALIQPSNLDGWKNAATFALDAVKSYSTLVGKYPHPKASVVDGALDAGGGMEYPMITVISSPEVPGLNLLDDVVTHEVGHNWFQGILGSNERANAWLDEGLNSYYEGVTLENKYGFENGFINQPDSVPVFGLLLRPLGMREYFTLASHAPMWAGNDLPNNQPAENYDLAGNATVLYHKTALTMYSLRWYLGEAKFNKMMQSYFEKWKFKHPYPEDFYANANESTGEDLTWFFDQFMKSRKNNDFVISSVESKKTDQGFVTTVKVSNNGDMMMPAPVYLTTADGQELSTRWDPRKSETVEFVHQTELKKVGVNTKMEVMELNHKNNTNQYEYAVHPFIGIPGLTRNDYYYFPVLGYEGSKDKFQIGAGIFTGHPISGPSFIYTSLYYAPNSKSIGFRNHYRYRMPNLLFNYSDFGWNVLDQEGFSKQEFYFLTKFDQMVKYNATAEIGLGHYKNYDQAYMTKSIYQLAEYSTVDLTLNSDYNVRSYRALTSVKVSQGVKVINGNFDFTRFEFDATNIFRFASDAQIVFRTYAGQITGSAPFQEAFFAGGNPDPRRNALLGFKSGSFSLLDNYSVGGGMRMLGYAVGDTLLADRSGLSTRLAFRDPASGFEAFVDAGSLGSSFGNMLGNQWFYDAGFGYNATIFGFYFPLYVSKPPQGEKEFEFRFVMEVKLLETFKDIFR